MNVMLTMMMITLTLSTALMMLASSISKKSMLDSEKSSPFECGFDPFYVARSPFSLKFFLVAVIFLIFDVEIAIILPLMLSLNTSCPSEWYLTFTAFIVVLLVGLYHEWGQGALTWK